MSLQRSAILRSSPYTSLAQLSRVAPSAERSSLGRYSRRSTSSRIASTSCSELRAMSRYRRNSRGPRLLAPSAMLRATLYAARLHWSPNANRSSDGGFRIASRQRKTSFLASRHARKSRKSPMRRRYGDAVASQEPFQRDGDQRNALTT